MDDLSEYLLSKAKIAAHGQLIREKLIFRNLCRKVNDTFSLIFHCFSLKNLSEKQPPNSIRKSWAEFRLNGCDIANISMNPVAQIQVQMLSRLSSQQGGTMPWKIRLKKFIPKWMIVASLPIPESRYSSLFPGNLFFRLFTMLSESVSFFSVWMAGSVTRSRALQVIFPAPGKWSQLRTCDGG